MAISKIILNGVTQMDLTGDTVTAATLLSPQTAHGADGEPVTGTAVKKVLTTKTITANGTYDAEDDNADGYSSVEVNVPSSGGSNWTLLATTEYTVNTTNTSNQSVGNIQLTLSDYNDPQTVLWVHIRDKAGKRAGYIYGSDALFFHFALANGTTTSSTTRPGSLFYVNSSGNYAINGSVGYGVYAYRLYYTSSSHYVQIYSRYNSSYGTINGTFKVDVYKLTMPSGMTLFETT